MWFVEGVAPRCWRVRAAPAPRRAGSNICMRACVKGCFPPEDRQQWQRVFARRLRDYCLISDGLMMMIFFFYRSADFVEKYQLHSCRLDSSGKQKRVRSEESIKATSEQAKCHPAPADRLIPESLPVFWETSGRPESTFRAVLL